jgi:hypothetical protein
LRQSLACSGAWRPWCAVLRMVVLAMGLVGRRSSLGYRARTEIPDRYKDGYRDRVPNLGAALGAVSADDDVRPFGRERGRDSAGRCCW